MNRSEGITMIALIVTIIVLIILAGVSIGVIVGDNGIIERALQARGENANATQDELEKMNRLEEEYTNIVNDITTSEKRIKDAKKSGEEFKENTKLKDEVGNVVTIPGGFHVAKDSGIYVEEGVVIEDGKNNQFVWIPVKDYQTTNGVKTNNLARRIFYVDKEAEEVGINEEIATYYGEENVNSIANKTIDAFKVSANVNGGFYLGRYEQGENNVCKAEANAYTNVTRDEAFKQASAMFNENEFVTSELVSSYAWDTALNFICQNREESYLLAATTDKKYGNIGTNKKERTGDYAADNYCNIHDMVGNCEEWTTEYFARSGATCVDRGGFCNGTTDFAAERDGTSTTTKNETCSFRVQLYIKEESNS